MKWTSSGITLRHFEPDLWYWLFAEFGGSCCEEEASAQQIEFGAAIHAALQQLEAVDLSLSLAPAPRQAQGSAHRTAILIEVGREALHNPHAAGARPRKPRPKRHDSPTIRPLRAAAGANDPAEPSAQINNCRGLRVLHHPLHQGDVSGLNSAGSRSRCHDSCLGDGSGGSGDGVGFGLAGGMCHWRVMVLA